MTVVRGLVKININHSNFIKCVHVAQVVVKIIYYYERKYRKYSTIYFYLQPALRANWGKICT